VRGVRPRSTLFRPFSALADRSTAFSMKLGEGSLNSTGSPFVVLVPNWEVTPFSTFG
jgi:hypothetical protein